MLEKQGNPLTFTAHYIASADGTGKTGLTVTVDVWEITRAGVATEIVTGAAATEVGDGLYIYVLGASSVDAAAEYTAVFKTTDSSVVQRQMPSQWAIDRAGITYLDQAISSVAAAVWAVLTSTLTTAGSIGKYILDKLIYLGGQAIFLPPLDPDLDEIETIQGDDYAAADGRSFDWTLSGWPSVAGATVTVKISGISTSFAGSPVGTDVVRLELTAAQTTAIPVGERTFAVRCEFVGGRKATVIRGTWSSVAAA
jgi:hypothetical protein